MIPIPDLLFGRQYAKGDNELLQGLLETAFLGVNQSALIDEAIGQADIGASSWSPQFFATDLFLRDFTDSFATLRVGGRDQRMHTAFFSRVLCHPPADLDLVRFRQGILRELEADDTALELTESLYRELAELLDEIKASYGAKHDRIGHRLGVLQHTRAVIDRMASDFVGLRSGLSRIGDVAREMKGSPEYAILADLLDWEDNFARVQLDLRISASGRIRNLEVRRLTENAGSRFYHTPLRRWVELVRLRWRGIDVRREELINCLIVDVYEQTLPSIEVLVQLLVQLEVYLMSRELVRRAAAKGLQMCLADVQPEGPLRLQALFNPLLLPQEGPTVPSDIATGADGSVVIVTGPNSGGKTRLLQGLGLAQLLGQAGLYTPAAEARLPLRSGMFASLVYQQTADQVEGRLGTELLRIRTVFQEMGPRSLILLDELCSGTNPSEAVEIVTMVLRLLGRLQSIAFISTHFLDLAHELQATELIDGLSYLQVEAEADDHPTYQFLPGVAATSLAAGTARRLGVDFEQIGALIEARLQREQQGDWAARTPEPSDC